MSELARAQAVSLPTMSNSISAMVERGWVRREAPDGDRRVVMIDVTPTALQLGITFPVTITRPLWEVGIVTNQSLPEEDQTSRLRDILMAFRLRLASLTTVSPLLDFPVLLALPPSKVPQPVPLFALIQPDPTHHANVTLLLPNEVSLSITSLN